MINVAPRDDVGNVIAPIPSDAPPPLVSHFSLGLPTAQWTYRDGSGQTLLHVLRFDPPNRRKEFWPLTLWRTPTGLKWRWKSLPAPRPLYGLDRLAACPEAPVLICEGEKAADAAAQIFPDHVAVTSLGGAAAAETADWTPLAERQVTIWPDNDEHGAKYARQVAAKLADIGSEVSIIDVAALVAIDPGGRGPNWNAEGWDAANGIDEWSDVEALRREALNLAGPLDPGPAYISCPPYTMDAGGLAAEIERGRGKDKRTESVWLAAPFEILGASRDPHGGAWGKTLRWCDPDGRVHVRHVADADLHREPATLCSALVADGLRINRARQYDIAMYLSAVAVKRRVTLVPRTGWHEIAGQFVFVLPGETVGPQGGERVVLDTSAQGSYEVRGTLRDWQEGVGKLASGHVLPVLMISTALSGPLLHLARQEGGGVHAHGNSSIGKTTVLRMAASVWGAGGTPGYVRTWRATSNGLEGAAAGATDTALILDELGHVEARELAAAAYSLVGGAGKARATRDGGLLEPKTWRVMFLSSGEIPIDTKMGEDRGRRARAGQLIRMLDIPAARAFGVFDHPGPDGDPAALSRACTVAGTSAYGTAGPEFVRRVIAENVCSSDVRALVNHFVDANVPLGADGQIVRAAQRFGLIAAAGELATALGVTPWFEGEARAASAWGLAKWIEGRGGTEPAEVRQAVERVRLFIEQHGESRFDSLDHTAARPVQNRAGWRKGTGEHREWLIPSEVWKVEVCAGLDAKYVAKVLSERGMLSKSRDGNQKVVKVAGISTRVYAVTPRIFDGAEQ